MKILRVATGYINWRWVLLSLILALSWMLLPVPMPGDTGSYNTISRLSWCSNPRACTHEQGHALDQTLGWPSQGEQFSRALEIYTINEMKSASPATYTGIILDKMFLPARWGQNTTAEIYAEIYLEAGGWVGAIPELLRKYYEVSNGW